MDAADECQVRLFGTPRVAMNDKGVVVGPARRRAVFAALAMNPGRLVPRDELIAAVWGDDPPAKVAGSVYTHISALRRVLGAMSTPSGEPILTATRAGYCLNIPPDRIDVIRFADLLGEAEGCHYEHDLAGEREALRNALAIWQNAPLADVPGPAAATHRARLIEQWLNAVERLAELRLADGEHAEVAAELAERAREYPLRENLHRLLMQALWQDGRTDEALHAYHQARQAIVDATGIEPGPALTLLYERIRSGRPDAPRQAHRWGADAPQLPPRAVPFVGRRTELDVVDRALKDLTGGRGGSLLIEGEPGAGKTALLLEVIAAARAADVTVLWSTTDELAAMTSVELVHGTPLGHEPPGSVDGVNQLDRCTAALTAFATRSPTVIVTDDFHCARDHIVTILRDLHRATAHLPLLLIVAARPHPRSDEFQRVVDDIALDGEVLTLAPLTADELRALAESTLGHAPTSEHVMSLDERSGGNPAYARFLLDCLPQFREDELRELVSAQHVSLSRRTQRVLTTVALLGGSVPVDAVAVAMDQHGDSLREAIDQATTSGVLVRDGERIGFRIPLVREAYEQKTPSSIRTLVRQQLAARLAEAGIAVEVVGELLLQTSGALQAEWVPEWVLASVAQLSEAAPATATELLRRAVRQPLVTAAQRAAMLAALARLLLPPWPGPVGVDGSVEPPMLRSSRRRDHGAESPMRAR